MRFQDLPVETSVFRVRAVAGSSFGPGFGRAGTQVPVSGAVPTETPGVFDLTLRDSIVSVTPSRPADAQRLNDELRAGRTLLAMLTGPDALDGSFELQIAFFTGAPLDMGTLEIGVDEYVEERVERLARRPVRDVYDWLEDRCTFTLGGEVFFFLTAGPAIEDALRPDQGEAGASDARDDHDGLLGDDIKADDDELGPPAAERSPAPDPTVHNSFCLTGSDVRFVATTTRLPEGGSIYVATKLTERRRSSDRAIRLAKGNLRFLDWTATGQIQLQTKAQLGVLTSLESSYLKKWDEFGDLEGEILLDRARSIGALTFCEPLPARDGTVSVSLIEPTPAAVDGLANGQVGELELVDAEPEYLTDSEFSFEDFSRSLIDSLAAPVRGGYLQVVHYDRESKRLVLKTENLPPTGTLVLSMAGDIAQIKRRLSARGAILEGRSANPQLGLLIEEKGEITSLRSPQKVKPLTAFVRQKVFRNPPTPMQVLAIQVALNTPDIALIQGPPGTGKTTVIAAILERLNEIAAANGTNVRGQVLLTGFQHDAVENMIDRISLNGIPVPKFGLRSGAVEGDMSAFDRSLEEWGREIARELRDQHPHISGLEQESAINDIYRQYLQTPTRRLAATLVERIAALEVAILGTSLARRARGLADRLAADRARKPNLDRHLAAVRRIRTRPASWADDGPQRAEEALVDLEDLLDEPQVRLLERACAWTDAQEAPPFLAELGDLRRSLLIELTDPPEFRVEKHSDEVLSLADAAIEAVRRSGLTATDRKTAALAEFLGELENNPSGMVDAVSNYSFAFAATAQQSVSGEVLRRKGIRPWEGDNRLEYQYVIIDEAARVSPRDLMIPMSQGKRIILVGDHRQLPHIVDDEVARSMEAGEDGVEESEWLKQSMFEYLFSERLKALEERDGIQRSVTLDKQFRMHPDLGNFVSRNFYERFDRNEKFDQGLGAGEFTHDLPGTHRGPASWLDVPASAGPAQRIGTSWTRQAEVSAITGLLKDWVELPQAAELTFGVISFYKSQADRIRTEVRRLLGSVADDDRRLRVGTVDSFQGMEFDVVLLSVVRTVPHGWAPTEEDRARQARRLFGHLGLYNRLNVSMSRQKKLLVVVGDAALVTNDLAPEFIPGLVDFYKMSEALER
jgi:hypothetical protein